jgi:hypothetical protein
MEEFKSHVETRLRVLGIDPSKVDWTKLAELVVEIAKAVYAGGRGPERVDIDTGT